MVVIAEACPPADTGSGRGPTETSGRRPRRKRLNGKSRLVNLVLLPLRYGNKDIIRDNISECHSR